MAEAPEAAGTVLVMGATGRFARAAVGLAAIRDRLARFEDVPFPGYTLTGAEIAAILSRVCGRTIGIRPFPWWQLRLARPAAGKAARTQVARRRKAAGAKAATGQGRARIPRRRP
ncbi:hypothetical protein [Albidovulum sp.]